MSNGKVLVLIGGGHSHVQVLRNLKRSGNTNCILVSDSPVAVYSGMLPAVVAGLIPHENSLVHLQPLCVANQFHYIHGKVIRIETEKRRIFFTPPASLIQCSLHYDLLSIDIGSRTRDIFDNHNVQHSMNNKEKNTCQLPLVVYTRPILRLESAIVEFERLARIANLSSTRVVVVGAGAAGIELAFALEVRLRKSFKHVQFSVISQRDTFGTQFGRMAGNTVAAECRRRHIICRVGNAVASLNEKHGIITLDDDAEVGFDLAVIATGAAAHKSLLTPGLQTDAEGWLLVEQTMQCKGHKDVFAAGDCVSFGDAFTAGFGKGFPPKAGVYAVRQGPILTHNLQERLEDSNDMKEFWPQASFLSLLSLGDGRGIGAKYNLSFSGEWVYRLKSHIDEKWQEKFRVSKQKQQSQSSGEESEQVFSGSAVEGGALLMSSEDLNMDDSFGRQLSVLRRMDCDAEFRETLVKSVSKT